MEETVNPAAASHITHKKPGEPTQAMSLRLARNRWFIVLTQPTCLDHDHRRERSFAEKVNSDPTFKKRPMVNYMMQFGEEHNNVHSRQRQKSEKSNDQIERSKRIRTSLGPRSDSIDAQVRTQSR